MQSNNWEQDYQFGSRNTDGKVVCYVIHRESNEQVAAVPAWPDGDGNDGIADAHNTMMMLAKRDWDRRNEPEYLKVEEFKAIDGYLIAIDAERKLWKYVPRMGWKPLCMKKMSVEEADSNSSLVTFLEDHENDIAMGINDFSDLYNVFIHVLGRDPA